GLLGALIATFAVVLPAFVIILLLTAILKNLLQNRGVQAVLSALEAAVIGVIFATGILMIGKNCFALPGAFSLALPELLFTQTDQKEEFPYPAYSAFGSAGYVIFHPRPLTDGVSVTPGKQRHHTAKP
ncbi:MAG: chromate transporter, partial [Clostridia bacterium]|nr:chromate transporter [Clostridia bacterium]